MQFREYLERAEYVKGVMNNSQVAAEPSAANGAQVAKGAKAAGGGGGRDVSLGGVGWVGWG